jgi:hypothetical protein
MVYVARKELLAKSPSGDLVKYKAGDVIPDFEQWDIHARRANLNLEWVEAVEDQEVDDQDPEPVKLTPGLAATKGEAPILAPASELVCSKCPDKTFKSERALKTHIGIAHKA